VHTTGAWIDRHADKVVCKSDPAVGGRPPWSAPVCCCPAALGLGTPSRTSRRPAPAIAAALNPVCVRGAQLGFELNLNKRELISVGNISPTDCHSSRQNSWLLQIWDPLHPESLYWQCGSWPPGPMLGSARPQTSLEALGDLRRAVLSSSAATQATSLLNSHLDVSLTIEVPTTPGSNPSRQGHTPVTKRARRTCLLAAIPSGRCRMEPATFVAELRQRLGIPDSAIPGAPSAMPCSMPVCTMPVCAPLG